MVFPKSIQKFHEWCKEKGKNPLLVISLDEYNTERGWKSKYIGRRVQVNADNSITII